MERKTNLRALRHQYGISLPKLSAASGLSIQYINQAELGQIAPTPRLEEQLKTALSTIIIQRKEGLGSLERSFAACKGRLLQPEGGEPDE